MDHCHQQNTGIDIARLQKTRDDMDSAVPDALVTGYQGLIPAINLPDPDDRHVLAAAIRCGANAIVTFNEKDFPACELTAMASTPDIRTVHQRRRRPQPRHRRRGRQGRPRALSKATSQHR